MNYEFNSGDGEYTFKQFLLGMVLIFILGFIMAVFTLGLGALL